MSMNLHLKVGGGNIPLWQTPSQITKMCLVNRKGTVDLSVTGRRARHALEIYIQWVKGSLDGVWKDKSEYENKCTSVGDHIQYIRSKLKKSREIEVYQL